MEGAGADLTDAHSVGEESTGTGTRLHKLAIMMFPTWVMVADLDPHYFRKLDLDPHYFRKLDPDPH